ncbi:MAG: hypothetical protein WA985_02930, partial [Erythrobacter sp.]
PPPPPPPPPVETVPYRPLPPNGAAYVMGIPDKNFLGQRQTINRGISRDEELWHFRSAWNVAALNCTDPIYEPITEAYGAFIADNKDELRRVNQRIDREYTQAADTQRDGMLAREDQMTAVYNFFALPPARARFCRAALDISNRALAAPPTDPAAFARDNFALLEEPFEVFFEEYEQYQQMSAEWDRKWGELYGATQPGWVAVQAARANGRVPSVGDDPASTLADPVTPGETVSDPDTGVNVPVVPVPESTVSQPVVEPVSRDRMEEDAQANEPQ